ncbi:porin family protein [Flavobacterium faecale]|uniref:porin family protein n=1 Tax=Flavobacterium faecale TaxID=1355330 RepID=UPI003AB05286
MRQLLFVFSMFSFLNLCAQEELKAEKSPIIAIDSLYREDQFYFGFTFNNLKNKPADLSQNKFSTGFSAGFLRDMPVNKKRTVAIASGVGFTYNNYIQNLAIEQIGETTNYSLFSSSADYSKNRFSQLFVDVPIEFRWRTSTYESYKFWRVYGGVKFSYLLYDRYVSQVDGKRTVLTNNSDFDKLQYGIYAATGYNTFNVYAYYGLNGLFKSAKLNNESIDMQAFNVGVIFYIL